MKNPLTNLSDSAKGILLIIGGSALVLNYLGFIELLDTIIAIVGLVMIVIGAVMAKLHEKIYLMIKKDKNNHDNDNNHHNSNNQNHHNQQPPQGF